MRTASIIRVMSDQEVCISETSAIFYETTQRNIPEGSYLHTRRRDEIRSPVCRFKTTRMRIVG
jgi:hypothetical protein